MSIELTADQIAELRTEVEKMTPSAWQAVCHQHSTEIGHGGKCPPVSWMGFDDSSRPIEEHRANARGIVLLRNHAPALIAAAEENAKLRAALLKFVQSVTAAMRMPCF